METKISICVIAYNRVSSLSRLLLSLDRAYYPNPVDLNISIDKSETDEVEQYADGFVWQHGEKRVIKHEHNMGLRAHVLSCGDLLKEYDALVVLEDDISVAESFFIYATQCVEKYKDSEEIAGISLYNFPLNYHNQKTFHALTTSSDVFLMSCAQSWGQVWMRKQWFAFREWYNSNSEEFTDMPHLPHSICSWPQSSWLKYHTRYCIENKKYFIYPYIPLSTNNNDVGTHAANTSNLYQTSMLYGRKDKFNLNPTVKYDGYFENEILYSVLGLTEENCCIDFYGEKGNRECRRYWLTLESHPYKVVKSFALEMKPYEANVIYNREGNKLFLYDTSVSGKSPKPISFSGLCSYLYTFNFGIITTCRMLLEKLMAKIIKQ